MNRFVVLALAACGSTTAPATTTTTAKTAPVEKPKPVDEGVRRAQLADAHHKLEEEQQDALAATCTEPTKQERCLPSCYAGEALDPRATKRPQQAIAIEHLACEKQGGDGSGPFTLADEAGKLAARPARWWGKPHAKATWQATVETAFAGFARPKKNDAIVVTSLWKNLEHPITKEKLRCVTVTHFARGIRSIDGCGEDGSIGCEAMGDPAAHGINVVHFRLAEAQRLKAAGKSADCQQAALEAIAVARGLPRWRQYMQLNVAKWTRHVAYRTRFDGLLDEDTLFTTAIALGKEAEAIHAACGGASATTTPAQEQSFHTCWCMSFTIRPLDRATDRRGVQAIDTAFETTAVFDLVAKPRGIELVERTLAEPLIKRYSIGEVFAQWARWEIGWVAEADGAIRGFATIAHEEWHGRIVLWFLYISPAYRRRGIGRALLSEVEAHGRAAGASHVWLETSNVNVPGVAAYERLGYALCGADTRYYDRYMPDETAIYLAKPL